MAAKSLPYIFMKRTFKRLLDKILNAVEHKMAVRFHLAESYVLNELDSNDRVDFEWHMTQCAACKKDVIDNYTAIQTLKSLWK